MSARLPTRVAELRRLIALERVGLGRDEEELRRVRQALESRREVSRLRVEQLVGELAALAPGVEPLTWEDLETLEQAAPRKATPDPMRKLRKALRLSRRALRE